MRGSTKAFKKAYRRTSIDLQWVGALRSVNHMVSAFTGVLGVPFLCCAAVAHDKNQWIVQDFKHTKSLSSDFVPCPPDNHH